MTQPSQTEFQPGAENCQSPMTNWLRQRPFHRPAFIESCPKILRVRSNLFRPVGKNHGPAHEFYHPVVSLISALLSTCRPVAILLTISSVVVAALYGVAWCWPGSDISQKHSEISPLFRYLYATPAVSVECLIVRIGAAIPNAGPNPVLRRSGESVRSVKRGYGSNPAAPTGRCVSFGEIAGVNNRTAAAFAGAIPQIKPHPARQQPLSSQTNSCEFSEQLTSQIVKLLVRRHGAWNDFRRFDVVFHIVFSRSRSVTWSGFCVSRLSKGAA